MIILVISILFFLLVLYLSYKKYNTFFNPWFAFFSVDVLIFHIASMFGAYYLGISRSENTNEIFYKCTGIYFISYGISYFYQSNLVVKSIKKIINFAPEIKIDATVKVIGYSFFITAFILLASVGKAGLLWFYEPRLAYLDYRGATGDGALFTLVEWALIFSLLVNLPYSKKSPINWLYIVVLHCFFSYFLGSKQILLTVVIYSLFAYQYVYKRISIAYLFYGIIFGILFFLISLGDGDLDSSVQNASVYLSEYFLNTSLIFENDISQYFWPGELLNSTIWTYLPRFLFSQKPYEYGVVLINSIIFPGAAERGQTPGLIAWSQWYVDFGFIGLGVYGFFRGLFEASVFLIIDEKKFGPVKTGFLFGISITPIYLYAPILYQYIFMMLSLWILYFIKLSIK